MCVSPLSFYLASDFTLKRHSGVFLLLLYLPNSVYTVIDGGGVFLSLRAVIADLRKKRTTPIVDIEWTYIALVVLLYLM